MTAQERIREALNGQNTDQQRIAEQGLELVALLLRKNADYGSSAWNPPTLKPTLSVGDAILVRMSDKVARIATLAIKEAEVAESLEDTIRDLGGYAILWLARPSAKEQQHAQQTEARQIRQSDSDGKPQRGTR